MVVNFNSLSLQQIKVNIMTTTQLRAQLFLEMNPLLDSETAIEKILLYVRSLSSSKIKTGVREGWDLAAQKAHLDSQDKFVSEDMFPDDVVEEWKCS